MKKKTVFGDWKSVYGFTFKQGVLTKGFKVATVVVALLLFLAGITCNLLMAVFQKNDTKISSIEKVYVVNESELEGLDFDGFMEDYQDKYPSVTFENTTDTIEQVLETLKDGSSSDIVLQITQEEDKLKIGVVLPYQSVISKEDGETLAEDLVLVVQQSKLMSLDIPIENLVVAMSDVSITQLNAGEEESSLGEEIMKMIVPILIITLMYFMNLIYGQSMGNIVSVEKSSKLMEFLLTMTKPYGIIFGKILATASIAVFQMILWIGSFVGGFFLGNILAAEAVYSDYKNVILETVHLIRLEDGCTAFSIGAVVLAFVTLCLAFLFYCFLAGMVASFAAKAEDLAQTMAIYQVIMIVSFFAVYMAPLQENQLVKTVLYFLPITSAYILPGDILVGNITVWKGILYTVVLIAFLLGLFFITGKVYKDQLLNRGRVHKRQGAK